MTKDIKNNHSTEVSLENLKEWACSFSGLDGGNIDADTWLCGIEWGGGGGDEYYKDVRDEMLRGKVELGLQIPNKFNWKKSISFTYGRSFAKLYKAYTGGDVKDYKEVGDLSGKELFKCNLYPIGFASTDPSLWEEKGVDKLTGFATKHLFNTWCFFNRFPFFSALRKEHKPKLIICTGVSVSYLKDFLMFFGGADSIGKLETGTIEPKSDANQHPRDFYWVKLEKDTTLVVIPFFSGRYGLNSNYLLQEMGKEIRRIVETGKA